MSERDSQYDVDLGQLLRDRHQQLRTELIATDWLDYAALAEVRGATLDATRYAVHKAAQQHQLLVVPVDDGVVVPAFQLAAEGVARPELVPLLELLLGAGMDPWRAWAWLTQPAALTLGRAPEEAVTDPEMTDLVRHAAARLAEHVGR